MPPKGNSASELEAGAGAAAAPIERQRYRIGYAFPPKKEQSFIQPSLLRHASQNGIDFVPISNAKEALSLSEQGPFHCIIHKLYGHHWNQQLKEYSSKHPQTLILDPPESIARLHNRVSMLDVVSAIELTHNHSKFKISVPKQVVLQPPQAEAPKDLEENENEKLFGEVAFPAIAKPLLANGSAKSHEMCLVFDDKGLQSLVKTSAPRSAPILLQQFVNHGGVVFKVYVIGEYVECVKRTSLPDFSEEQLITLKGQVLPFSQISNSPDDEHHLAHEMPPREIVEEVARGIRLGLKLNFFNFDVIRDSRDPHSYYVIDINYFPGYAKLPSYERLLTDFLLSLVPQNHEKDGQDGDEAATHKSQGLGGGASHT